MTNISTQLTTINNNITNIQNDVAALQNDQPLKEQIFGLDMDLSSRSDPAQIEVDGEEIKLTAGAAGAGCQETWQNAGPTHSANSPTATIPADASFATNWGMNNWTVNSVADPDNPGDKCLVTGVGTPSFQAFCNHTGDDAKYTWESYRATVGSGHYWRGDIGEATLADSGLEMNALLILFPNNASSQMRFSVTWRHPVTGALSSIFQTLVHGAGSWDGQPFRFKHELSLQGGIAKYTVTHIGAGTSVLPGGTQTVTVDLTSILAAHPGLLTLRRRTSNLLRLLHNRVDFSATDEYLCNLSLGTPGTTFSTSEQTIESNPVNVRNGAAQLFADAFAVAAGSAGTAAIEVAIDDGGGTFGAYQALVDEDGGLVDLSGIGANARAKFKFKLTSADGSETPVYTLPLCVISDTARSKSKLASVADAVVQAGATSSVTGTASGTDAAVIDELKTAVNNLITQLGTA